MSADSRLSLLLPPWLRRLPADLVVVLLLTLLTVGSVFLPVLRDTPLRVVFGLVFLLFVPGYALTAALFPEGPQRDSGSGAQSGGGLAELGHDGTLTGLERVALSLGLSIAIVPLIGLGLNFTPFGIRLVPIVASVTTLVVVLVAVAARRRLALPANERLVVPLRAWVAGARSALFAPQSRTDAVLNVFLVIAVLAAAGSVAYAVSVPSQGESFSEFYLLTEDEDGTLVADDYPQEFTVGEPQRLVVGIGNQEHEQVSYTVLVELHRVRTADNSTTVLETERLQRFDTQLSHNETWQQSHAIEPTIVGDRLRLTYLLYQGDPPANPTVDNAYREVHLWVNVTAS
jgi:uncharacterized membrane protein